MFGNRVTRKWKLRVGFPTTFRQPTHRKHKTSKTFSLLTVSLPQGCFRKDKVTTIPILAPYLFHITAKIPNYSRRSCLFTIWREKIFSPAQLCAIHRRTKASLEWPFRWNQIGKQIHGVYITQRKRRTEGAWNKADFVVSRFIVDKTVSNRLKWELHVFCWRRKVIRMHVLFTMPLNLGGPCQNRVEKFSLQVPVYTSQNNVEIHFLRTESRAVFLLMLHLMFPTWRMWSRKLKAKITGEKFYNFKLLDGISFECIFLCVVTKLMC